MNNPTMRKILTSLFAVLSLALSVTAQSPHSPSTNANVPSVTRSESKQIGSIRSENTPNGSRVTITSNEALIDYGAYRNGDNFMVLIPGAELALTEISVKGVGFTNSKLEARGTNLAFSFQLESGVSPSISQNLNRLVVTFTRSGAAVSFSAEGSNESVTPDASRVASDVSSSTSGQPGSDADRASAAPVPTTPAAPDDAAGTDADSISQREVDLTVPESPAFTVLGVNPETVVRPSTAREFATSLLNGVDQQGNFQSGLALDFVPYLTFFGAQTSLASYRKSRMERFLARTQLSFATTKGVTEEDKATRLALGLRMTLWDRGDPRLDDDLDKCYALAFADPRISGPGTVPGESPAAKAARLLKRKQLLAEVSKPCDDTARKLNWNASGWIVGLAPSWISKNGQTKSFVWNGGGFWTSLAYGFDNVSALKTNSQLIFHARYRNNEIVPDSANKGKFFSQDSVFLGGRLRIAPGTEAKSILSFEGNLIRSRRDKGAFDNSSRYSLGLEQRLADNIWFSLALGGQSGRKDNNNDAFILSSFKWGFGKNK